MRRTLITGGWPAAIDVMIEIPAQGHSPNEATGSGHTDGRAFVR